MTDQEIRIEIAECCGWKWVGMHRSKTHGYWYLNLKQENVPIAESGKLSGATPLYSLPNYPEDLNAMHEAEKTLSGIQTLKYEQELLKLCSNCYSRAIAATAHQRAEAFLRAIGKWKDQP